MSTSSSEHEFVRDENVAEDHQEEVSGDDTRSEEADESISGVDDDNEDEDGDEGQVRNEVHLMRQSRKECQLFRGKLN